VLLTGFVTLCDASQVSLFFFSGCLRSSNVPVLQLHVCTWRQTLPQVLEIKSVVVHFQGKAFNTQWIITSHLLVYQLVEVTKFIYQKSHKQHTGDGGRPTDKGT
jgi:hypothetical protein